MPGGNEKESPKGPLSKGSESQQFRNLRPPPSMTALLSKGGSTPLDSRLRSWEDCSSQGSRHPGGRGTPALGEGLSERAGPWAARPTPARGW